MKPLPSLTSAIFHVLSCLFDLSKNKIETQQKSHKRFHLHRTNFPCYVKSFCPMSRILPLFFSVKTTISHIIMYQNKICSSSLFVLFAFYLTRTHSLKNLKVTISAKENRLKDEGILKLIQSQRSIKWRVGKEGSESSLGTCERKVVVMDSVFLDIEGWKYKVQIHRNMCLFPF